MVITKVYQCGNSLGVVYLNENHDKCSTLIGTYDWFTVRRAIDENGRMRLNGKAQSAIYEMLYNNLKAVAERKIREQSNLSANEELATARQIDYAYDLTRRYCEGEWRTLFGSGWFKSLPTRNQIAGLGKRNCSRFIDDLKTGY